MTVEEIIGRIRAVHGPAGGHLPNRLLWARALSARGLLLSQRARKKQRVGQGSYQTLPCAEMVPAPPHECPCLPPVGGCFLRTRHRLPQPLPGADRHLLQSVTSADGAVHYSETSWLEKKYRRANRYTARRPDWYLRGGYLYVTHGTGAVSVSVTGLFGDPLEAVAFPSQCGPGQECEDYLSLEFPMDGDLVDALVAMAATGAPAVPGGQRQEGEARE